MAKITSQTASSVEPRDLVDSTPQLAPPKHARADGASPFLLSALKDFGFSESCAVYGNSDLETLTQTFANQEVSFIVRKEGTYTYVFLSRETINVIACKVNIPTAPLHTLMCFLPMYEFDNEEGDRLVSCP